MFLCVQHIQQMPKLVHGLVQRPKESARLLRSLIRATLADRIHTAASMKLMQSIAEVVPFGDHAEAAAQQILAVGPEAHGEERKALMDVFR